MTLTYGELFAGYGGLGMGVQSVLGGEMAWCAEYEAAPSAILAHHWPDVPNYGDVTKIDWATRWSGIPTGSQREAFVYVLYGARRDRQPVYIGKARVPGQRFDRHAQKEWWGLVRSACIYKLTGADKTEVRRLALAAETRAIAELDPIFNVAHASWRWT